MNILTSISLLCLASLVSIELILIIGHAKKKTIKPYRGRVRSQTLFLFNFWNVIHFLFGTIGFLKFAQYNGYTIHVLPISIYVGVLTSIVLVKLTQFMGQQSEKKPHFLNIIYNHPAEVFRDIPENISGAGKVFLDYKGSRHELHAVTQGCKINNESMVDIVETIDCKTVLVIARQTKPISKHRSKSLQKHRPIRLSELTDITFSVAGNTNY